MTDINSRDDQANAVVLQPTGPSSYNIVVAGQTVVGPGLGANATAWSRAYTQSGGLDTGGFGGGAGYLVATNITGGDTSNGVAVTSTAIVLAGHSTNNGAELLSTDASGSTALARTPLALGAISNIDAITVAGSDYLVAGTADSKFVLAGVVQSNLTLDPGFGAGGKTETAIGTFAQAASIAVQSNGKIDIAGFETDSISGFNLFATARYSSTGARQRGVRQPERLRDDRFLRRLKQ